MAPFYYLGPVVCSVLNIIMFEYMTAIDFHSVEFFSSVKLQNGYVD